MFLFGLIITVAAVIMLMGFFGMLIGKSAPGFFCATGGAFVIMFVTYILMQTT